MDQGLLNLVSQPYLNLTSTSPKKASSGSEYEREASQPLTVMQVEMEVKQEVKSANHSDWCQ